MNLTCVSVVSVVAMICVAGCADTHPSPVVDSTVGQPASDSSGISCTEAQQRQPPSPEETLHVFFEAVSKDDWATASNLSTPTATDSMVGGMISGCVPGQMGDEGERLIARYMDAGLAETLVNRAIKADPINRTGEVKAVAELVADKPAFISEFPGITVGVLPRNWMASTSPTRLKALKLRAIGPLPVLFSPHCRRLVLPSHSNWSECLTTYGDWTSNRTRHRSLASRSTHRTPKKTHSASVTTANTSGLETREA